MQNIPKKNIKSLEEEITIMAGVVARRTESLLHRNGIDSPNIEVVINAKDCYEKTFGHTIGELQFEKIHNDHEIKSVKEIIEEKYEGKELGKLL